MAETATQAVLYVEDDPFSREIMAMILQEMLSIPTVTIFEDSENFLVRVNTLDPSPSIILLDIQIKPLDGFGMLAELRNNGYLNVIVVALTASVMSEEIHRLREAGFDGIISKPVNMETFPLLWKRLIRKEPIWGIV